MSDTNEKDVKPKRSFNPFKKLVKWAYRNNEKVNLLALIPTATIFYPFMGFFPVIPAMIVQLSLLVIQVTALILHIYISKNPYPHSNY